MSESHDYPYHPIVTTYPAVAGAERDGMRDSIRERGVSETIKVWVNEESNRVLVDGRTRLELWKELVASGELDPVKFPLPVETVTGSEVEIIDRVEDLNGARRHMSASQRAASTIRMWRLRSDAEKASKGKKRVKGDQLEQIARRAGLGRTYLYDMKTIAERAPDLEEAIIAGTLTVPEAIEQLNERLGHDLTKEGGKPKKKRTSKRTTHTESETTTEEGGDGAGENPEERTVVIYDGLKNQVDDPNLQAIFAARDDYAVAEKLMRQLLSVVKDIEATPGAATLNVQGIKAARKTINEILRDHKPHAACPVCKGTGKKEAGSRKRCEVCSGHRYLDAVQYAVVTSSKLPTEEESDGGD
jgi:hypothetical protein